MPKFNPLPLRIHNIDQEDDSESNSLLIQNVHLNKVSYF